MMEILRSLAADQGHHGIGDVAIVLSTGEKVLGAVQVVDENATSIIRFLGMGSNRTPEYADVPRHYATSAIIAAYIIEGS